MNFIRRFSVVFIFCLYAVLTLSGGDVFPNDPSPVELDRYLDLADDSFEWTIVRKTEKSNENTFLVEMTSQTWHGIPWKHYLLIVLPNKMLYSEHAVLYIGGKGIGHKPGDRDLLTGRSLAETTGMPVGMLFQVPNQPLLGNHYEDALIGETMLKAIESKDATWPLLFPMAKSAVRAMDAVQQVLKQEKSLDIEGFVVAGASKRGWTTWLTAASKDPRVVAIAPIVIDTLNMRKQMEYQLETWGDYSPSIHDYTSRNLVQKDESKLSDFEKNLWTVVDPYSYRSRYVMPKLLIHGTNDPYWTLDATKHYWDDLPGVKYLLTIPNAGHGLDGGQIKAFQSVAVFFRHAVEKGDWPKMSWKLEEQADSYSLSIDTDLPDKRTKLWTAHSETKDFRKAVWSATTIKSGTAEPISVAKPKTGHVAFFVELSNLHHGLPFSVTTQVYRPEPGGQ